MVGAGDLGERSRILSLLAFRACLVLACLSGCGPWASYLDTCRRYAVGQKHPMIQLTRPDERHMMPRVPLSRLKSIYAGSDDPVVQCAVVAACVKVFQADSACAIEWLESILLDRKSNEEVRVQAALVLREAYLHFAELRDRASAPLLECARQEPDKVGKACRDVLAQLGVSTPGEEAADHERND